jgi:hypothetical protein
VELSFRCVLAVLLLLAELALAGKSMLLLVVALASEADAGVAGEAEEQQQGLAGAEGRESRTGLFRMKRSQQKRVRVRKLSQQRRRIQSGWQTLTQMLTQMLTWQLTMTP